MYEKHLLNACEVLALCIESVPETQAALSLAANANHFVPCRAGRVKLGWGVECNQACQQAGFERLV